MNKLILFIPLNKVSCVYDILASQFSVKISMRTHKDNFVINGTTYIADQDESSCVSYNGYYNKLR